MTPGDRTSCLGSPSPHALSQRLLEYSESQGFAQGSHGPIQLVLYYPKVILVPAHHFEGGDWGNVTPAPQSCEFPPYPLICRRYLLYK